jgi:hypothetical protein
MTKHKKGEKMKMKFVFFTGIILLASNIFVIAAIAQNRNPTLDETITIRLGPLWSNFDATITTLGQDADTDTDIDADDIDFAVYGLWRITDRFRIEAGYSGIDKKSKIKMDDNFNLSQVTVPTGAEVKSKFKNEVARLAVGYAIMRGESSEFGLDLGVNFTTVKESLSVDVAGIEVAKENFLDVSEPLPTIGIFFNYAFNQKWFMTSRAGVFAFDIGDIDGTIYDLWGGIEYRPWENFGVGFAATYYSADITVKDDRLETDLDYDYYGPLLYFVAGF